MLASLFPSTMQVLRRMKPPLSNSHGVCGHGRPERLIGIKRMTATRSMRQLHKERR
jgi:hypothetical protein